MRATFSSRVKLLVPVKAAGAVLIAGLAARAVSGQEAIPAAGGDASGTGGKVSVTTGQAIYTTYSGTAGSVSQGVQQAYVITVATSAGTGLANRLECKVFPNPVQEMLSIEVSGEMETGLSCRLFDQDGKLLLGRVIDANLTFVPMGHLPPSSYVIRIEGKNQAEVKTFKIVKN